jgi:hypothetical protein
MKTRFFQDNLELLEKNKTSETDSSALKVYCSSVGRTRKQGRGVHVTGVSAAYTFKLNKNILSE